MQEVRQQLAELGGAFREAFDDLDAARESALQKSREVIRSSSETIKRIHRGEIAEAEAMLRQTADTVAALQREVASHPDIAAAGFVCDALKEHAEAHVTLCILTSRLLPSLAASGVDAASYANGMAEAVGEMRRYVLDRMRAGEAARSEDILELMDEIYYLLVAFDYPEAVTRGLRRRVDSLRGLLERTRGDLTSGLKSQQLQNAILGLQAALQSPSAAPTPRPEPLP